MTNMVVVSRGGLPLSPSCEDVRRAIEADFIRAQAARRLFTLIAVSIDGASVLRAIQGHAVVLRAQRGFAELVAGHPMLEGALGFVEDDHLMLGFEDLAADRQDELCLVLRELASRTRVDGAVLRLTLSIGIARNDCSELAFDPDLLFETLHEVACSGAEVSSASGGDQWTHTELYGLIQGGLAREEPRRVEVQRERVKNAASLRIDGQNGAAMPERPADLEIAPLAVSHARPGARSLPRPLPGPLERLLEAIEGELGLPDDAAEGTTLPDVAPPGVRLRPVLEAWFREHGANITERDVVEYRSAIDRLERRVRKLSRALRDSEEALRQRAPVDAVESWVASAYREVQGLSEGDVHYELKKALMAEIFEANAELRRRTGS